MKYTGKKTAVFLTGIFLGCVWLSGCRAGNDRVFPPSRSEIYVDHQGVLYTALVENYDADNTAYNIEELRQMAQQEMEGHQGVTLTDCTMEDGAAAVVYQYTDGEALVRFTKETQDEENHVESIQTMTVMEGLAARTILDGVWTDAKKGQPVDRDKVMKKNKMRLVCVDGDALIQTGGTIRYYSGAVTLEDFDTARVHGTAYLIYQ